MLCALLLRFFDLFPLRPNRIDSFHLGISKDVGMTSNQFFGDVRGDLIEIALEAGRRDDQHRGAPARRSGWRA